MRDAEDSRAELVKRWWDKAEGSLKSAMREHKAGENSFAINRVYYAAFYAVTAWLLENGKTFKKHSGVRHAFHEDIIKTGLLSHNWSKFYDRVFQDRNDGDYLVMIAFEDSYVEESIDLCRRFLEAIHSLLSLM